MTLFGLAALLAPVVGPKTGSRWRVREMLACPYSKLKIPEKLQDFFVQSFE
jgi:hypothetical protein